MLYVSSKLLHFQSTAKTDTHVSPAKFSQLYSDLPQHLLPPSILKPLHSTLEQEGDQLQEYQLYLLKGGGMNQEGRHKVTSGYVKQALEEEGPQGYAVGKATLCQGWLTKGTHCCRTSMTQTAIPGVCLEVSDSKSIDGC